MLDRLERLPPPQRDALRTAFGLTTGVAPDRFLVGLAVLGLLSEVADERPLVCLVDDAQWLDRASLQALEFVARRLFAESVALVFAVRQSGAEQALAGLRDLVVEGLRNGDARALLGSVIISPLDERVRDRIVAETRGNPLALLELPRGLAPAELAGGFGLPVQSLPTRIEESFQRRLAPLPAETRRLLLVAAAEPVGEPTLVWPAAGRLGIGVEAADAAESEGLVDFGARVRFRHPLVRSAIYRAAPCAGGGHRSTPRSRSACVAPRSGDVGARRDGRRRTRALRRPCPGARRTGGGGRLPRTGRQADAQPGSPGGPRPGRGTGQVPSRRARCGAGTAGLGAGGTAGRAEARPGGPAAGPDRVRSEPRQRRSAAVAHGGQAA